MDIAQLIQTLAATVVGGLIVIAANWISVQQKRRNTIKKWYEKTYVTEGIDPTVIYLYNLNIYFFNKDFGGFIRVRDIDAIPTEAIVKLQILFDDPVVPHIIALAHALLPNQDKSLDKTTSAVLSTVIYILLDFRKELLQTIATKVTSKHDVIDVSSVVEKLWKECHDKLAKLVGYEDIY